MTKLRSQLDQVLQQLQEQRNESREKEQRMGSQMEQQRKESKEKEQKMERLMEQQRKESKEREEKMQKQLNQLMDMLPSAQGSKSRKVGECLVPACIANRASFISARLLQGMLENDYRSACESDPWSFGL